jgi:hypothetical protein
MDNPSPVPLIDLEFLSVMIFLVLITFRKRIETTTTRQAVTKMIFEKES